MRLDRYGISMSRGKKTKEYVDRDSFRKHAPNYPNLIMFQDDAAIFTKTQRIIFMQKIDTMKRETPCYNKCPWCLWYNPEEHRFYIQHGLNIEHTVALFVWWKEFVDGKPLLKIDIVIDFTVKQIKLWVEKVHEHLEKVNDDTRSVDWFASPEYPDVTTFDMGIGSGNCAEERFTN